MTTEHKVIVGDCTEVLKTLQEGSVDLVATDPPYGYNFMGSKTGWDKAVPKIEVWQECLRVLKPGAFAFVMSSPRQDVLSRMLVNIETAGFDISTTSLYWTYAQGFAKSMDMARATDKALGLIKTKEDSRNWKGPISAEAKALDGAYAGFQPKPAVECILVAMKPLREGNYVAQAMANGKGVTWLDNCRIPYKSENDQANAKPWGQVHPERGNYPGWELDAKMKDAPEPDRRGRFPANLLVSDDVLDDGDPHDKGGDIPNPLKRKPQLDYGEFERYVPFQAYGDTGGFSRYFSLDKWAERNLPFLIVPKPTRSEKDRGLNGRNIHPTVKPMQLMSYLITLGSRPGDLVLDPFAGSGTTGAAARSLGRSCISIERDPEYAKIAMERSMSNVPDLRTWGSVRT